MKHKIDFVITWVNGDDPMWKKERNHIASLDKNTVDNSNVRYRNWDTLKYWFRGVERFAPWVNCIYFVTCGHVPEWLNLNHPKLKIIEHSSFIPAENLPTFNSFAIEFYLHKIEGLSENFVYFNDDMFLIDEVSPSRFFNNGLPCDLGAMTINIHNGMFGASVLLAKTLINEHFNKNKEIKRNPWKWYNIAYPKYSLINFLLSYVRKQEFTGFVNPHLPQAYLKNSYNEVWKHCEKDLIRTSHNRFRNYSDICHWVVRYWQLVSGCFSPYNVLKDGKYFLAQDDNITEIADYIHYQKRKLICINDSEKISDFYDAKKHITIAFEQILPQKSNFEL